MQIIYYTTDFLPSFLQGSQYASSLDVIAPGIWNQEGKCTIVVEESTVDYMSSRMVPKIVSHAILCVIISHSLHSSTDSSALTVCNTWLYKTEVF